MARQGLRAFGRFWWGFLVGDTPELFVVVLVIVGAAFALRPYRMAAVVLLPVLVAVLLCISVWRGRSSNGQLPSPGQPSHGEGLGPEER